MKKFLTLSAVLVPGVAFAQDRPTFSKLVQDFIDIFDVLIPVLYTAAFLVFFWGLAKFIFAAGKGDETGVKDGKKILTWGIVALFMMVSLFALAVFAKREFGFDQTQPTGGLQGAIPLLPTGN